MNLALQGLDGACYYFLRVNTDKTITAANISAEVHFGVLDGGAGKLLNAIQGVLSQVMMPALKAQEVMATVFVSP